MHSRSQYQPEAVPENLTAYTTIPLSLSLSLSLRSSFQRLFFSLCYPPDVTSFQIVRVRLIFLLGEYV